MELIQILTFMDDTTVIAESKEQMRSIFLVMDKVKKEKYTNKIITEEKL